MLRRHRRRRAPGRRAVQAPRRPRDRASAGRPPNPDPRRRPRRPHVRHRSGEGHARARPERLRDRPPARPADAVDHGRAVPSPVPAPSSTVWTGSRRASRSAGGAARAGPDRRGEAPVPAQSGTPRAPRTSRSSRGCRCSGSSRSGRWRRPRATPCGTGASSSTRRSSSRAGSPGWTTCTTGASRASCGGATASRSGTGRQARWSAWDRTRSRRLAGRRTTTSSHLFSSGLWPFSTLGWPDDSGPAALLPDVGAGHRLRHPVLRRPDDVSGCTRWTVSRRSTPSPCTAWCATSTRKMSKSANTVDRWRGWIASARIVRPAAAARQARTCRWGRRRPRRATSPQVVERHAVRVANCYGRAPLPDEAERTDADRWILGASARSATGRRAGRLPVRRATEARPLHVGRVL